MLFVLLVSALGLAVGCGDDGGDDDPAALLQETFGEGKEVESGRLDLSLRINAQGIEQIKGPITLALRGPFQSSGDGALPKFDFEVDIRTGNDSFRAGAVSTGDKGFLRFQDQAYSVPDQLFKQFKDGYARQAKCNEERGGDKGNTTFRALGIDPRRWLSGAKNEGKEDVGGAETIHITSRIDVPKFLEDVNRVLGRTDLQRDPCADEQQTAQPARGRQLTEAQRKRIADAIKEARLDVWTGADDKILRRLNVDLRIEGPKNERGDVRLDLSIGGLNEDQQVKAPTGTKPLEELLAQLGGSVPGLGSGEPQEGQAQETPQEGGGGTGGEQAAPTGEYGKCIEEAGGDVQKLQQCAELIGQ
jgi:hypothetical protein